MSTGGADPSLRLRIEQRIYFRDQLRAARAATLRDSESFEEGNGVRLEYRTLGREGSGHWGRNGVSLVLWHFRVRSLQRLGVTADLESR